MHHRAFSVLLLLSLLMGGCTATYIPISWGMGEKVQHLSRSDQILSILYERFDPKRQTLAVSGASFNEVLLPGEVKHHLGAYRADTKLIYRNLFQEFTDQQLRDLMLHELAHHIWFGYMSSQQKADWAVHLDDNPTPLRDIVRRVYQKPQDHPAEDFAFTVEFAREVDIEELSRMNLLTEAERDRILQVIKTAKHPEIDPGDRAVSASGEKLSKAEAAASASGDKLAKAGAAVSASGDNLSKAAAAVSTSRDKLSKAEPAVTALGDELSQPEAVTTH